ncbi:hypothetical protein [Nitrosopumilus sp.]|uniref:hypothetical protein n=1 Tax=Nitrosopumilus sp. TaxID=2024843 RepID=UPI00247F0853|nr:hypothetical protein [Nitrosopumilus sp.]MCV0409533.1 hypothetical protein [Nitrosopumilus sp.]
MLPPSTIFSKLKISESNLKLIIFSGFAMYFLVLYEIFPQYLFDEQYVLFTLLVPLVVIVVGLNFKKINLKNLSLKNISVKGKGKSNNAKIQTPKKSSITETSSSENSEIDALLAGTDSENGSGMSEMETLLTKTNAEGEENRNPEIEAMLSRANAEDNSEDSIGGNSEIEALLAGVETEGDGNYSDTSLDNSDTELIIMEKLEPIENDIQTLKTDFDQFKMDLTTVKEEVEILSNSFETTLTDIKLLTTDMNNPLNFMKEDAPFKDNIQTINVDELIQKPTNPPEISKSNSKPKEPVVQEPVVQEPVVQEPVVQEPVVQEPVVQEPVVQEPIEEENSKLPEDVISLIDELSRDFVSEEVFELAKVHCKTLNITVDEKQLKKFIDKKNNSNGITKIEDENSEMEDFLEKTVANEVK